MIGRSRREQEEVTNESFNSRNTFKLSTSHSNILCLLVLPHGSFRVKATIQKEIKGCILVFILLHSKGNMVPSISHYFFLREYIDASSFFILAQEVKHAFVKVASNVECCSVVPLIKYRRYSFILDLSELHPEGESESLVHSQMREIIFFE
jgi:hypothetical protein